MIPIWRRKFLDAEISAFSDKMELRKYLLAHYLLKEGDIAIDVGAYVGTYANLFSQSVTDKGKVFAYEPNPYLFKILQNRLKRKKNVLIGFNRIKPVILPYKW